MSKKPKLSLGEEAIYDISFLSLHQKFILGLQHMFAMFGATVLVPILTGLNVSTTLFMAGMGTFLFHFVTKGKVPAFLGSSFAFVGAYMMIAKDRDPNSLALASGGVVFAGLIYLLIAILIKVFGVKKIMAIFPPVVTGPIIIGIGLTLSPVAISFASQNWSLALMAFFIIVVLSIFAKGMLKIIPILLSIAITYIFALLTNQVDLSTIANQNLIALPLHSEFFAKFDLSAIITVIPISIATIMEHIGDISAISATTKINYLKKPGLHRTLIGDGLATSLAAFFGGPANTTYGENTGVLALSKVYDPKVMQIAAGLSVLLSFFPALSKIIETIPMSIIGGVSMILYGMISAIGIRNIVENQVDLTKSRNLIIVAAIMVCALGFANNPLIFTINNIEIKLSSLAISAIAGIFLNIILPGKDYKFDIENPKQIGENVDFSSVDTTYEGLHKNN